MNLCSSGIFYYYLYLMSLLGAGGSPTSAGSASAASSGSNKSGSNSTALSPHAGNSMVFALLLALISGSLAIY